MRSSFVCAVMLALWTLVPLPEVSAAKASSNLEAAVSKALERSPSLRGSMARQEEAQAVEREASWRRLPALSARTSLTRGDNPVYAFGSLLDQRAFTAQDFAVDRLNWPGYRTNMQSALEAGLPLFTGFDISNARSLANLGAREAAAAGEGLSQRTRFEVLRAYLEILLQRDSLSAVSERAESAEKELQNAERLRQKGLVLGSDYYAAEAILSGLKAWQAQISSKLAAAKSRLDVLTGGGPVPAGRLGEKTYEVPAEPELVSKALEKRTDIRGAAIQESAAEVRRKMADSSILPKVDAFAAIELNNGDFSAAPSDRIVGVRLNMPFGDPAYAPRRQAARARLEESRFSKEAVQDAVKTDVLAARAGYVGAVESLPQVQSMLERSQKSLELFRPLYREGRQSVLEVLRAEEATARAQAMRLEALYGVHAGYAALRFASGSLDDEAVREIGSRLE